ncbi:MAG: hypothetical protein KKD44_09305 [Proteobacteria bacterium]|nr:hypothetical protein [Pseudomonadota bacterium]
MSSTIDGGHQAVVRAEVEGCLFNGMICSGNVLYAVRLKMKQGSADYLNGSVALFDLKTGGLVHESPVQTFMTPTSTILGRESLSFGGYILMTQMSENGIGVYRIPEDL